MEAFEVVRRALTPIELLRALWIAVSLTLVVGRGKEISSKKTEAAIAGGFLAVFLFGRSWLALVNHYVPEPYLVRHSTPGIWICKLTCT